MVLPTVPAPAIIPPDILLAGYADGMFPMADDAASDEAYWVTPVERAVLPLAGFRLSRSLARTLRRGRIQGGRMRVSANAAFDAVVAACAAPAPGRETTWINPLIADSYRMLHAIGHAHSIEVWDGAALVGGLYGVSLGRAFFGESMFSRATDASKVALAHLVARLRIGGFVLLDCQFMTGHLASLGAVAMPQAAYLRLLQPAVSGAVVGAAAAGGAAGAAAGAGVASAGAVAAGDWGALDRLVEARGAAVPAGDADAGTSSGTSTSPGHFIVQLLTNTS